VYVDGVWDNIRGWMWALESSLKRLWFLSFVGFLEGCFVLVGGREIYLSRRPYLMLWGFDAMHSSQ
jgi:hypothetical protein